MSGPSSGPTPSEEGWRLLLGLGNPGSQYAGTRHNVGFDVLDLLARRLGLGWERRRHGSWAEDAAHRCVLVKPLTYMNRSGVALREAWLAYGLEDPAALFVVTDDFHLPLGALRVRASGSTGGHNGLASLEDALGSRDYPRLRIGVGDPRRDAVEHVLSAFSAAERPVVQETLETASWAAEDWVLGKSPEDLQARYNRRTPQADS